MFIHDKHTACCLPYLTLTLVLRLIVAATSNKDKSWKGKCVICIWFWCCWFKKKKKKEHHGNVCKFMFVCIFTGLYVGWNIARCQRNCQNNPGMHHCLTVITAVLLILLFLNHHCVMGKFSGVGLIYEISFAVLTLTMGWMNLVRRTLFLSGGHGGL